MDIVYTVTIAGAISLALGACIMCVKQGKKKPDLLQVVEVKGLDLLGKEYVMWVCKRNGNTIAKYPSLSEAMEFVEAMENNYRLQAKRKAYGTIHNVLYEVKV